MPFVCYNHEDFSGIREKLDELPSALIPDNSIAIKSRADFLYWKIRTVRDRLEPAYCIQ